MLVENPHRKDLYYLFVKLITDESIEGVGEWSTCQTGRDATRVKILEDLGKKYVIGADPFRIERLWQNIYATDHDWRHPGLSSTPALSAIEMACWDIVGKALKQPVYNLLGGMIHEKLFHYSYMPFNARTQSPEDAGVIAATMVKQGYSACKFDPFYHTGPQGPYDFPLKTIKHVATIFKHIRDAVGDDLEIGLGTHGQFTTYTAIRIAKILEKYNLAWFEEPVHPENVKEMARVAAHTSIPIATGERLLTKYEFVDVLEQQAAQILQFDVGHCGGILEAKKIASMAEAYYAGISPHMACAPVAAAAAIQLDVCSPNFIRQEYNFTGIEADLFKKPITFDRGYIIPPTEPGLGIELNEDYVLEHRYLPS
jgi:2-dehydro-3-deoxyphosphogalactonate aldolase